MIIQILNDIKILSACLIPWQQDSWHIIIIIIIIKNVLIIVMLRTKVLQGHFTQINAKTLQMLRNNHTIARHRYERIKYVSLTLCMELLLLYDVAKNYSVKFCRTASETDRCALQTWFTLSVHEVRILRCCTAATATVCRRCSNCGRKLLWAIADSCN